MSKASSQISSKHQNFQVFTIEVCPSCNFKTKRPFELGDYFFKPAGECSHCNKAKSRIEMIYAERTKKS
ncbi:MAG: hypothetical protein ACE5KU_01360 [Nitrososphaerales archaeon]